MTLNETRLLGIEFERRLLTLDPSFESYRKPDTETIYSFLNEAQKLLFTKLYNTNINASSLIETSKYLNSILSKFIVNVEYSDLIKIEEDNVYYKKLPENFFSYISSNSTIISSYKQDHDTAKRVNNKFVKYEDFTKYINEYIDENCIIRHPLVTLSSSDSDSTLYIHPDVYTNINSIQIYYYKLPNSIDFFKSYKSTTDEGNCELPISLFEELVETAVALYIQYIKGILSSENNKDKTKENLNSEEQ